MFYHRNRKVRNTSIQEITFSYTNHWLRVGSVRIRKTPFSETIEEKFFV